MKTDNLIIYWVPYRAWMAILTIGQNMKSSKIPISKLFSELEKISKYLLGLYSKNSIFHIFPELRKIENSFNSNIQKSQNLFVNWEKFGTTA